MTKNDETLAAGDRPRRGDQAAEIAAALRRDIVCGALPAERVLRQEHLAERFGVSRMPVRDALRRLADEGFVSLQPNRGAVVAPLGLADLREIYEMRVAAETLALRLALPEISNAQLDRAEAIQDRLEQAPVAEFGALNNEFHKTLYSPCGRPRLLSHIEVLGHAADRYLRITVSSLDYAGKSHREHRALLPACMRRDERKATQILTKHIEEAGEALASLMKASEPL